MATSTSSTLLVRRVSQQHINNSLKDHNRYLSPFHYSSVFTADRLLCHRRHGSICRNVGAVKHNHWNEDIGVVVVHNNNVGPTRFLATSQNGTTTMLDRSRCFDWQQFLAMLGVSSLLVVVAQTMSTMETSCDDVVIDPSSSNVPPSSNVDDDSIEEKGADNVSENPLKEEQKVKEEPDINQQPQQKVQFVDHVNLVKRIARRSQQMERWLGDLTHDRETFQRYQHYLNKEKKRQQQQQQMQPIKGVNSKDVVSPTMTKPEILKHIAEKLIAIEGWGTSPHLIPLVVEQLEKANLQKYTKEALAIFYDLLHMDHRMVRNTGPCLPYFRSMYECLMMQPPHLVAQVTQHATSQSIQEWLVPPIRDICPLHGQMMQQCLEENNNIVQLIRYQQDFEKMISTSPSNVSEMLNIAKAVEWIRLPFTWDVTAWQDYVKVRGWTTNDLDQRFNAEQEWRQNNFFQSVNHTSNNKSDDSTSTQQQQQQVRGQPYWEMVQHEWTDVPVVTLHVDLPRIDPTNKKFRLVKAWACDANMPQPQLLVMSEEPNTNNQPKDDQDSEDQRQAQVIPVQQPLVLGLVDGNPNYYIPRRRGDDNKVSLPISILAARTQAVQIYALYADESHWSNSDYNNSTSSDKTKSNVDGARLYYTAPLSLERPVR